MSWGFFWVGLLIFNYFFKINLEIIYFIFLIVTAIKGYLYPRKFNYIREDIETKHDENNILRYRIDKKEKIKIARKWSLKLILNALSTFYLGIIYPAIFSFVYLEKININTLKLTILLFLSSELGYFIGIYFGCMNLVRDNTE